MGDFDLTKFQWNYLTNLAVGIRQPTVQSPNWHLMSDVEVSLLKSNGQTNEPDSGKKIPLNIRFGNRHSIGLLFFLHQTRTQLNFMRSSWYPILPSKNYRLRKSSESLPSKNLWLSKLNSLRVVRRRALKEDNCRSTFAFETSDVHTVCSCDSVHPEFIIWRNS